MRNSSRTEIKLKGIGSVKTYPSKKAADKLVSRLALSFIILSVSALLYAISQFIHAIAPNGFF